MAVNCRQVSLIVTSCEWENVSDLGRAQNKHTLSKSNEKRSKDTRKKRGVRMLVQGRMEESQTLSSVESAR